MEIEVQWNKVDQVQRLIGFDGCFVVNPSGLSGGLVLLWKTKAMYSLLSYSKNFIDVQVQVEGLSPFRFIGFYGMPNPQHHRQS